jgi:pyrroline-5-carboxylate reductase
MKEVAIIGMGNMGLAIENQLQDGFRVVGIGREDDLARVHNADIVILAVKPQSFPEVASELRLHVSKERLVISIMAGITVRGLADALGTERVVRTMPNLALKTSQSMTTWYTEALGVETDTEAIVDTWGRSKRLKHEDQFDASTAIGGSGMAYYFELAYLIEEAGARLGLSASDARMMSLQTLRGAASVLEADSSPEDLVQKIASKGGTTEAALTVFRQQGFGRMVDSAIEAACERSRELGRK